MADPTPIMPDFESDWIIDKAKQMSSAVEVGSFEGGTTINLLKNVQGPVWAIDPWEHGRDTFLRFANHVHQHSNLIIMKMRSLIASHFFAENSVDMVFIDGDHTYLSVKADIIHWLPVAKVLICGHDYGHPDHPGVKHAVDKLLDDVQVYETIWYKYV